jgi:homoserine kinase
VIVRVPGSSANLGPGFDALGMAVTRYIELTFDDHVDGEVADVGDVPDVPETGEGVGVAGLGGGAPGRQAAEEHHPAVRAFTLLGGTGPMWVRSSIPMGRGLGFSGSARVAGLVAAMVQREGPNFHPLDAADELLHVATALEGHADNIAPSIFGGVVATAGGRAVRVPLAFDPCVVVWVPSTTTSTEQSRAVLGSSVPFTDAVFNVGRTALLVAALAAGDTTALRTATEDRLHQDQRFERAPVSRLALEVALDSGAWCGWLSGSGPTIAALCPPDRCEALAAALPAEGRAATLRIDHGGAVIER